MSAMTEQQYVERRLDDQIGWLDGKSAYNQRWSKLLRVFEIAAAAAVPVLVAVGREAGAAVAGAMVTVVAGLLLVYKFDESWINFRTTWSALTREKMLHQARVAPYDVEATRYARLVNRVEAILASESEAWKEIRVSAGEAE